MPQYGKRKRRVTRQFWAGLVMVCLFLWVWGKAGPSGDSLPQWIIDSPWGHPMNQITLVAVGQVQQYDYPGQWSLVYNRSNTGYFGKPPMYVPAGEGIFFLRNHQGGRPDDGTVKVLKKPKNIVPRGYELSFHSDGLLLRALVAVPAGKGPFPAILVCPAYEHDADDTLPWIEYFANNGYVAMAFDYRGDGLSTAPEYPVLSALPKKDSLMRLEYKLPDAINAVKALSSLPEVDPNRIGTYGHSMGASIAIDTAEESNLVAAVACTGLGYNRGKQISSIDNPLWTNPDPTTLARVKVPNLMVQGELDELFPLSLTSRTSKILAKGTAPHQFILVPGSMHAVCNAEGVREILLHFFNKCL